MESHTESVSSRFPYAVSNTEVSRGWWCGQGGVSGLSDCVLIPTQVTQNKTSAKVRA